MLNNLAAAKHRRHLLSDEGVMKPGDVIFIQSQGVSGRVNRLGQGIASFKKARFTHVLLYVAPGVVIDATPQHGVMLRNVLREIISERLTDSMCDNGTMLVLRPTDGNWNPNAGTTLVSTMAHIRKKYNWRFLLHQPSDVDPKSEKAKSAFCSELVALLLKQWGLLSNKAHRSSKTLPVNLAKLLRKSDWRDVTSEWRDKLQEYREWAESADPEVCKNLGLALYQGNQQISLLLTQKQVGDNQKSMEKMLENLWSQYGRR